ncbi:MAG: NAD(+) synthase, partial [Clostridia bacterium]|nr:NAD(+) synthase [Clostridia bacterium]
MQYGLIRTAAIAPEMRVADPEYNALSAAKAIKTAAGEGAQLVVLPRLFLTGCTCGALFNTASLIKKAESALLTLAQQTEDCDCAVAVGLPVAYRGRLFDCAAVLCAGQLVGLTCAGDPPAPFAPGKECFVDLCGAQVPMAPDTVYRCENAHELSFNIEIGEVLPALAPITVHLDASPETAFSDEHRAGTILARTRQSGGAMICCCPGTHESTTDFVYSGAQLIAENGVMLAQSLPFEGGCAITEIDYELVCRNCKPKLETVEAEFELCGLELTLPLYRTVEKDPFMPSYADRDGLCRKVLELQARGLARRMAHTNAKAVVLGISGGLDSTLALLVAVRACRILGKGADTVQAVTMPCFGTS